MKTAIGFYPSLDLDTAGTQVVSPAGAVLLTETIARVELSQDLSAALASRRPGWRCTTRRRYCWTSRWVSRSAETALADVAVLRAERGVFGLVASDPTVSRTIDRLAAEAPAVLGRDRRRPRAGPGLGLGPGR